MLISKKKIVHIEKVEVTTTPLPTGVRIYQKEDVRQCIIQENSRGGHAYIICSSQGGRGGAFPHKAGKHESKKLSKRLDDDDNRFIMTEVAAKFPRNKIVIITFDCNDLTKLELDAMESILIQYVRSRNPDCYNKQKTGGGYRYDPNPPIGIPGVTKGPFKCPQNIGTAAQKKLGQDLMFILGM